MAAGTQIKVTIEVRYRWWVPLYLHALSAFCMTFGTLPDADKVGRVIERGIVLKVS